MNLEQQIIQTTEARRHNGQCGYGEWEPLADLPEHVAAAIADEVAECMAADMRRESRINTDEAGLVEIGGQGWEYRR